MLIDRAGCPYAQLGAATAHADCGPLFDDLEINRGWRRNADGTDTATSGLWQVAKPVGTSSNGPKQPGKAVSGSKALVTGASRGRTVGSNDVDGGATTIRSRAITLPADAADYGPLTFWYAFAHTAASSSADAFQALVEAQDGTRTVVFERKGGPTDVDGTWKTASVSLAAYAGQTIRLVFLAKDGGKPNLVEAAVDSVRIQRP